MLSIRLKHPVESVLPGHLLTQHKIRIDHPFLRPKTRHAQKTPNYHHHHQRAHLVGPDPDYAAPNITLTQPIKHSKLQKLLVLHFGWRSSIDNKSNWGPPPLPQKWFELTGGDLSTPFGQFYLVLINWDYFQPALPFATTPKQKPVCQPTIGFCAICTYQHNGIPWDASLAHSCVRVW